MFNTDEHGPANILLTYKSTQHPLRQLHLRPEHIPPLQRKTQIQTIRHHQIRRQELHRLFETAQVFCFEILNQE